MGSSLAYIMVSRKIYVRGKITPKIHVYIFPGKLNKVTGRIVSRRLTWTAKNTLTPFYGVKVGATTQATLYV